MLFLSLNRNDHKILDKLCENFQVLLRYSSPSCIHCSNMLEEWLKLKDHNQLKHFNNLAIVDANTEIAKNQKHLSAKKHILNNEMVPCIFFINKNKDYGDSYKDYGVVGIIVRTMDKINRLKQVSKSSIDLGVPSETLKDTLLDLSIYSVLGLMELERLDNDIHN